MTFRGADTVMITPFPDSGVVNVPALRPFVDWQIDQGIHGLIALGSTGEFSSLDDDEKALVSHTVIATAAGRVSVLIGTGADDTRDGSGLRPALEHVLSEATMVTFSMQRLIVPA